MRIGSSGGLLLVIALAGCAVQGPRPPAPPPAALAPAVREQAWHGGFITARVELPPDASGAVPAVVTLFGEQQRLLALGIAAVTYQVHWELLRGLAPPQPPAPPSEKRWGQWLLASPDPRTVGQGYFNFIGGAASDTIPRIVDWLQQLPEIDGERIGTVGVSTNGFTALEAAADPRITAAVAIAACGDYHCFLERSPLGLGGQEAFEPTPEYEAILQQREPIRHPDRFVHAAVLMVNGGADHAVPFACAEETAAVFSRFYAAVGVAERFRFVPVEGGGHDLGDEARYQAMAWFQRWLAPGGGVAARPRGAAAGAVARPRALATRAGAGVQ